MKLAIGFSFYNSEKEIPRALDDWYDHVDCIIALDGRYWTPLSPQMKKMNLPIYSTDNSQHVLKTRFGDKLIYEKLFAPQMEKRQRCMDIAGEEKCDFLVTVDSDDYIHPDYQDFTKFKNQLESVLKYWDDDLFYQWAWIPDEKLWPRQHNDNIPSNSWKKYVRIHKNPGEQRYTLNHFTWTKKDTTDDMIRGWNWNPDNWRVDEDTGQRVTKIENPYILQAHTVIDGIRITTDRKFRSEAMLTFGDGWAFQNMHYETYTHDILPAAKANGMKVGLEDYEYFFDENGRRRTYNKDGSVMTQEQVDKIMRKEEQALKITS